MIKAIIFDCIGVLVSERGVNTELFDYIKTIELPKVVLSNYTRSGYEDALPAEYRAVFDRAFLSAETGYIKPDPAAFLTVLEYLKCEPGEVLFIDDLAQNTNAAEELGLQTLIFENTQQVVSEAAALLL